MKEKIKYLITENWTLKIFGIEVFENKKFDISKMSKFEISLFVFSLFCYFLSGILAVFDVKKALSAKDIMGIINSFRIDYRFLFLAFISAFLLLLSYRDI